VYLGSLITTLNDTTAEIKRRILFVNRCYYRLAPQLQSRNICRSTKCKVKRKVLRIIYGAIEENGIWRKRYNFAVSGT